MNFKRFHESRNLWTNPNEWTNEVTDTRTYFQPHIALYSGNTALGYVRKDIKADGYNFLVSVTPDVDFDRVYIKHNGSTRDIQIANIYGNFKANTPVTLSFDVNGHDPTTVGGINITNIMLNEGSTALPYEPYSSEVWHDIPHYIHSTATDTITTLPADIYANDTTATVGLKGQTVQSGTPTPDNPIMPEGTGERTGNLFPQNSLTGRSIVVRDAFNEIASFIAFNNGQYVISMNITTEQKTGIFKLCFTYTDDSQDKSSWITKNTPTMTFASNSAKVVKSISITDYNNFTDITLSNIMLNTGSTALPYELYGYKIPISMGGTTNNVYLGEVQTTRQIQKLVLTGSADETWNGDSLDNKMRYYPTPMITNGVPLTETISTHFAFGGFSANSGANGTITGTNSSSVYRMYFWSSDYATVDAWKSYLAQQYANGTPVTVWYVLANETTAIVNEPLMRIGDYADSLTTSIPCTAGENTLDVDTTVQPSEVTATFEGWHAVSAAHERSGGAWD